MKNSLNPFTSFNPLRKSGIEGSCFFVSSFFGSSFLTSFFVSFFSADFFSSCFTGCLGSGAFSSLISAFCSSFLSVCFALFLSFFGVESDFFFPLSGDSTILFSASFFNISLITSFYSVVITGFSATTGAGAVVWAGTGANDFSTGCFGFANETSFFSSFGFGSCFAGLAGSVLTGSAFGASFFADSYFGASLAGEGLGYSTFTGATSFFGASSFFGGSSSGTLESSYFLP